MLNYVAFAATRGYILQQMNKCWNVRESVVMFICLYVIYIIYIYYYIIIITIFYISIQGHAQAKCQNYN